MEWEDKPEVEAIIKDLAKIGDVGEKIINASKGATSLREFKNQLLEAIGEEFVELHRISNRISKL